MKAVVLAAGAGTRLRRDEEDAPPKCLRKAAGKRLIEHILEAVAGAGIEEAVVVTGYRAGDIPKALGACACGVAIEYVHNPRWHDLANGHSLLVARDRLDASPDTPFLLLMSDHVFDPALLPPFLRTTPPEGGATLLVEPDPDRVVDLNDATKVRTDGAGGVVAMGKALEIYDAVDTGIFLATQGLLDALASAKRRGASSLTDGCLELAARGRMRAVPIRRNHPHEGWWFDLDTSEVFEAFEAARHKT